MAETSIFLAGNLTDDPELRHTTSGVARATFRVAVSGRIRDGEAGATASRRSTPWWCGGSRPCTPPSRWRRAAGTWWWAG
jgi:single-stranded DNA-binding protein